jgi:hypothetical protein
MPCAEAEAAIAAKPAASQNAPRQARRREPESLGSGRVMRHSSFAQNMIFARDSPVTTVTAVATILGKTIR